MPYNCPYTENIALKNVEDIEETNRSAEKHANFGRLNVLANMAYPHY